MTKEQFLQKLEAALKKLPLEERQDILQDFEEHFAFGKEEGKTEEEIAASLGSPQQIGKELLASYHLEKVEATASTGNIFRAVWAVIGLGFFNLIIVLGPFIALVALIASGWIVGITGALAPILELVNVAIFPYTFGWFNIFFSLILSGLGLFILIGMYFATRALMNGFVRYLKFNTRLVKGGLKA